MSQSNVQPSPRSLVALALLVRQKPEAWPQINLSLRLYHYPIADKGCSMERKHNAGIALLLLIIVPFSLRLYTDSRMKNVSIEPAIANSILEDRGDITTQMREQMLRLSLEIKRQPDVSVYKVHLPSATRQAEAILQYDRRDKTLYQIDSDSTSVGFTMGGWRYVEENAIHQIAARYGTVNDLDDYGCKPIL